MNIVVFCVVATLWLIWDRPTAFHQQNYNPKNLAEARTLNDWRVTEMTQHGASGGAT